ncbi:GH3 auxin-responsive promoter family protein [Streptosporangium sp. NPDC002721]|uniref:GH3 family domain-containing protein n=1 Tax=Streptosporangium sp. NPDC002721 TaxID=3366188 RepID=UPI00367D9247
MASPRSLTERADAYRLKVVRERDLILGALDDARAAQETVLDELLTANKETVFGREHGFSRIRDADGYRRAVPIRGHEEFSPWLERVHANEKRVLTGEEPMAFFASSGTTGAEKTVPVTKGFLQRCFLPFYFAGFGPLAEEHSGLLTRDDAVLNLWQDPHSRSGRTIGGKPHLGPSQLNYGKLGEDLAVGLGNRAPWSDLPDRFRDASPWERSYLRVRIAAEHDVRGLIAVNPAIAAALPYQLGVWTPRIIQEIHDGTLGGRAHRPPDPGRARVLARLAERNETLRPADLWPELELLLAWNTYVARLYLPALLEDYGAGTELLPAPIGSSEGPLAIPVRGLPAGGPLVVTSCFYEFVPADDALTPDAPTLLVHELRTGEEYHVVLSHRGGLYRCAIRDIVRVTGVYGATPVVEYASRAGTVSTAGERVRESHVLDALLGACAESRLAICNVMYRALPDGPAGHEAAIAFRSPPDRDTTGRFTRALDAGLRRTAPGYDAARRSGALAAPVVRPVAPERFFTEWRRRVETGERPPRVKDRLFQAAPDVWDRVTAPSHAPGPERAHEQNRAYGEDGTLG